MKCFVINCCNYSNTNPEVSFYPFPKNEIMLSKWLSILGPYQSNKYVCSQHFNEEDFYFTRDNVKKLKSLAVPVVENETYLDTSIEMLTCRICLATSRKMFDFSRYSTEEDLLHFILGSELSNKDRLPRKICWECSHRISSIMKFRKSSLNTQILLKNSFNQGKYATLRNLKAIKKFQPNLTSHILIEENIKTEPMIDDEVLLSDNAITNEEAVEELYSIDEASIEKVEDDAPKMDLARKIEVQIEIKHENNAEIFVEEYNDNIIDDDHFNESDDDKTLLDCKESKKAVKPKVKVKRKKKVTKARVRKKIYEDSPANALDKYKKSEIKRRRHEALDESQFIITTPSYEDQIAEIEKRAESTQYKSSPYKCTICFRGFMIKERFDVHSVKHSDQSGAFECFICKTRLKTSRALRKHLTAQHTEMISCKGCSFFTRNRGVAREHEKWHSGTTYQCPHCATAFDKLTTYMGHIRIKHPSDFICELCGYTFISKKGVDVHKKKKHRVGEDEIALEGPYCEVCDVKFGSAEAHDRHLKLSSKHGSVDDPNRLRNDSQSMHVDKNGGCRRVERRVNIHPKERRDGDKMIDTGPITCEQCGVQLRDLRLYAQHFRRTHPDKNRTKYPAMKTPSMCEQCGRIFQSMALLKDHMWVHTGVKRFKCDRCEKSFTQKSNLVFHLRTHGAERPSYECHVCGKHFAFYNNRRRHMFIHTGLKPFKCDSCGKAFTTQGEQRAHIVHVHMKKPWPKRARARSHARD